MTCYQEKYIEVCEENEELQLEVNHLAEELKNAEEVLDNILPVLNTYLTEEVAIAIANEILGIRE